MNGCSGGQISPGPPFILSLALEHESMLTMLYGILIVAAILIPNLLWMAFPPTSVPIHDEKPESQIKQIMTGIENLGRIACFVLPIFFEPEIAGVLEMVALVAMILSLAIYYTGWIRYFVRGREYKLLFQPLLRIPLPMAIAPIIYFIGAVVILHSLVLLVAVILLAVGHLYISYYDSQVMDEPS
ncbi:MAG: hypothetical protein ACFFCX_17390 [Candidatus Sifarchaeia archaeon]